MWDFPGHHCFVSKGSTKVGIKSPSILLFSPCIVRCFWTSICAASLSSWVPAAHHVSYSGTSPSKIIEAISSPLQLKIPQWTERKVLPTLLISGSFWDTLPHTHCPESTCQTLLYVSHPSQGIPDLLGCWSLSECSGGVSLGVGPGGTVMQGRQCFA